MTQKPINYLNNKDMLAEIHKSKISFCEFTDVYNTQMDAIVSVIQEKAAEDDIRIDDVVTDEVIVAAREARAKRIAIANHEEALAKFLVEGGKPSHKPKLAQYKFDPSTIPLGDLVIRVLTYEHIPQELERKKTHRRVADMHARLNFIPFKHFRIKEDSESKVSATLGGNKYYLEEVLRSHSKNGEYSLTHGSITNKLATMFLKLVNKYSQRSNWRGYTYLDEMKGHALLQLSAMGLQFNEMKSDNPFSYYTASVSNSFLRVLSTEKQAQNLRDDLLEQAGQCPSFSRQLAVEEEIRKIRDSAATGE